MEPKNLTDIIADLSLVQNPQDPQKQQPSPAQQPKPDVIDQARGAEGPDWYRASDFIAPVGVNVQGTRIDQQIRPTAARRMQDVLDRMDQQDPTAPAPTPAQQRPFQDAAVALKKQLSDDLMRSFNATYAQNPDFAAEVNTIASRLNLSPDLVMRNPEEARKVYDMLTFQRRGLLAKNPAMATSLSDPKIMAVAKDDLDNLSWWDSGWNSYERSQLNMQKGYLGYALQSAQRFGNVAYEKELRAQIAQVDKRIADLPVKSTGFSGWVSPAAEFVGQQLFLAPKAATIGSGFALVAAGAGAATGPAAPVVSPISAAGAFFAGYGSSAAMDMAKITTGLSYIEQTKEGVDPEIAYWTSSGVGLGVAVLENFGLSAVAAPAKRALTQELTKGIAKIAQTYGADVVKTVLSETGTEVTQEMLQIYGAEIGREASGLETKLETAEGRAEVANQIIGVLESTMKGMALIAPLTSTPTLVKAFGGRKEEERAGAMQAAREKAKAMQEVFSGVVANANAMRTAEATKQTLQELAVNAKESKVNERDPKAYEAIVNAQLEQLEQVGGVDAKTVYISSARFAEALAKLNLTIDQLRELLPDHIDAIREALNNGNDVAIPTARFASTLANHELGQALMDDVRLSDNPLVLSSRDAKQQREELQQRMEEATAKLEADAALDDQERKELAEIKDKVFREVMAVPGFSETDARVLATMYGSMATEASKWSREKMTPAQFAERYPFTIVQGGKETFGQPAAEPAKPARAPKPKRFAMPAEVTQAGTEAATVFDDGQAWGALLVALSKMPELKRAYIMKLVEGLSMKDPEVAQQKMQQIMQALGEVGMAELPTMNMLARIAKARDAGSAAVSWVTFDNMELQVEDILNPLPVAETAATTESQDVLEQVERLDADYMAAVERGDMETAQRMVDQAAKAAGYLYTGYHASTSNFSVFLSLAEQAEERGEEIEFEGYEGGNLGRGFYFTPDIAYARRFGTPRKFYIKIDNILDARKPEVIEQLKEVELDLIDERGGAAPGEVYDELLDRTGADGVIAEGAGGFSYGAEEILIKQSNQAKLADPVTRDEQGNIIPLSRRFNLQSPSILEQLEAEPTTNGLALLAGKLDLGLGKRPTVADIARAFQSRVPEVLDWQKGLTDEQRARLVSNISDEVRRAYALHPEAKGWYDENVSLMLSVMRELDPDLAKPDNDFIFKIILAVSSNGNEVSNQFGMTWKTYEKWKQTGVISDEFITGDRIGAISKHFALINNSIAKSGMQATKEFFRKQGTVAEVRQAAVEQLGFTQAEAKKLLTSEMVDEVVPYASVFGPKLGSFYNNLNGDFSTVTMDRWFMRTLGRLTGTQVEKIPKAVMAAKANKLREALNSLSPKDKAALKLGKASWRTNAGLAKVSKTIAGRFADKPMRDLAAERMAAGAPQLDAVRLAGNAYKKALDPLVESPTSGGHRRWIRGIMGDVQQQLASTGIELEQADIQALLWYLEKEIYGKLNYRERSKEADYASSAAAQYESVAGQPSAVYAGSAGRVGGLGRSRDVAAEPAQLGQVLEQLGQAPNPVFYSALLKSLEAVPDKPQAASGWKSQIASWVNKGVVKQAEVEWSGLNEWLDMQEGKVTKEAVVAFLKADGVRVESVVARDPTSEPEYKALSKQIEEKTDELFSASISLREIEDALRMFQYSDPTYRERKRMASDWPELKPLIDNPKAMRAKLNKLRKPKADAYFAIEKAREDLRTEQMRFANAFTSFQTAYGQYTLPYGVAYREVLLVLDVNQPDAATVQEQLEIAQGREKIRQLNEQVQELDAIRQDVYIGSKSAEQYGTDAQLYDRRKKLTAEIAAAESAMAKVVKSAQARGGKEAPFATQHWQQENVLAHLRMNDRVDTDGKRVLFIEEIQSDWGEMGRKQGFGSKSDRAREQVEKLRVKLMQEQPDAGLYEVTAGLAEQQLVEIQDGDIDLEDTQAARDYRIALLDLADLEDSEMTMAAQPGVPRGPFVQTTKGWTELALKKVMLIAAEGGYDRVAFVNGTEAADRFAVSQTIDEVQFGKTGDDSYIVLFRRNGDTVYGTGKNVSKQEIEQIAGGELAAKIVAKADAAFAKGKVYYRAGFAVERDTDGLGFIIRDPRTNQPYITGYGEVAQYDTENEAREVADYLDVESEYGPNDEPLLSITGPEIRVGGEGMKAFYDKIVPNTLNDMLGKLAKTKVTKVNVARIGKHMGFDVTPALLDKISEGLPLFAGPRGQPRGMIGRNPFNPKELIAAIVGGKGKGDTVLHEMFHFYFYVMEDLVVRGDANEQAVKDFTALLTYQGTDLASWSKMDAVQRKPYYENVAYGWEIWLSKGEAPSVELDGVFRRIARWFRETYKNIVEELQQIYRDNFGRELVLPTQDVEQVFARMVASADAVDRSMRLRNMQFPFTDANSGDMAPGTLAALRELWEEMVEDAVYEVTGKAVSDVQWLSGADTPAMREMQRKHDNLRDEMRSKVRAEVEQEPIYKAMLFLRTGEMKDPEGNVQTSSMYKLDSGRVKQLLPQGVNIKTVGRYIRRNGLEPDEVATWFGFTDGQSLLTALAAAPSLNEEIDRRTNERMLEEHGDLVGPVAMQRAVRKAIDNDKRTQFLAAVLRHTDTLLRKSVDALSPEAQETIRQAEIRLTALKEQRTALRAQLAEAEKQRLTDLMETTQDQLRVNQNAIARERRKINGPLTSVRDLMLYAKRNAEKAMANKPLREVSSYRYAQQQARASKQVADALGKLDLEGLLRAQQNELLLHAMTKEANDIEDQVEASLDEWRKFFKPDERLKKGRDMDFVNLGRAILTMYGLGRHDKPADAYVEKIAAYDPELFEQMRALLENAKATMDGKRNYNDLTVEEFQTLSDVLDRLWTEAARKMQVGKQEQAESLAEVTGALKQRIAEIAPDMKPLGETKAVTEMQEGIRDFGEVTAQVKRVQHWCYAKDKIDETGKPGVFTKYFWTPINDAIALYLGEKEKRIGGLAEKFQKSYKGSGKIAAPELGYTFGERTGDGTAELFASHLHCGNPDNMRRHLLSRGWAKIDAEGNLDPSLYFGFINRLVQKGDLTQEFFDLLQECWDAIESVNTDWVQKVHRQQTGVFLDTIPAQAFTITFPNGKTVTYRGGYVPSAVDRNLSEVGAKINTIEDLQGDLRTQRPTPFDGFRKARVETILKRSMDPMVLLQAIDNELRWAILGPPINDILKILNDKEFAKVLHTFDPNADTKLLRPFLNAVATQKTSQGGLRFINKILNFWRGNLSLNQMSFNLVNASQNITGWFSAAVAVKPKYIAHAFFTHLSSIRLGKNTMTEWIAEQDPLMAKRMSGQVADAERELRNMFNKPSLLNKATELAKPVLWILQILTQNQVDSITWMAAYNQAMAEMGAEKGDLEAHNEAVSRARNAVTLTQHSTRPENLAQYSLATPAAKLFTQFTEYTNLMANLLGAGWKQAVRSDLKLSARFNRLLFVYMMAWAVPMVLGEVIKRAYGDELEPEEDQSWWSFLMWDLFLRPQIRGAFQAVPYAGQGGLMVMDRAEGNKYSDRLMTSPVISGLEKGVTATVEFWTEDEIKSFQTRDMLALFSMMSGIPTKPIVRGAQYQADIESGKVEPTSLYDYFRGMATGVASPESKR